MEKKIYVAGNLSAVSNERYSQQRPLVALLLDQPLWVGLLRACAMATLHIRHCFQEQCCIFHGALLLCSDFIITHHERACKGHIALFEDN